VVIRGQNSIRPAAAGLMGGASQLLGLGVDHRDPGVGAVGQVEPARGGVDPADVEPGQRPARQLDHLSSTWVVWLRESSGGSSSGRRRGWADWLLAVTSVKSNSLYFDRAQASPSAHTYHPGGGRGNPMGASAEITAWLESVSLEQMPAGAVERARAVIIKPSPPSSPEPWSL
jgi:hypothetical protein